MNSSRNNVVLLFFGKLDEVYRITGNTNGKLRIFFRMRLRVQKGFTVEYVYVKVIATVANVFYSAIPPKFPLDGIFAKN